MFKHVLRAFGVPLVALIILLSIAAAQAQPAHNHPAGDAAVHERFYLNWDRPDYPGNNCCKLTDCYPTAFKRKGKDWYALTRTVEKNDIGAIISYTLDDRDDPKNWVRVPPERLEQNQMPGRTAHSEINSQDYVMREPLDSPDGRSHVCMIESVAGMDAPGFSREGRWFVLCAVLGEES